MARVPLTGSDYRLTDNRLTIADLTRELDKGPFRMGRSAIQRFDEVEDVRLILGKQGDVYPAESLQWWRCIAEARLQEPPEVKPATAKKFLDKVMNNAVPYTPGANVFVPSAPPVDEDDDEGALLPPSVKGMEALGAFIESAVMRGNTASISEGVAEGVRQVVAQGLLPPVSDRVLTLKEAREQTGLSEATIRELPPFIERAGGRRKWKWSVLQARLAEPPPLNRLTD